MQVNSEDISNIIETVRKGVDKSIFGPVCIYEDPLTPTQNPKKIVNQVAFQVFLTTLTTVINKMESLEVVQDNHDSQIEIINN